MCRSGKRQTVYRTLILSFCFFAPLACFAQAKRVVVIKVDGLSSAVIERYVTQKDPRTGKSRLPWIYHLFYERGTRLENFYTRGVSLSAPSWAVLDSGHHQQIKGNVEFDRYTLHCYDYLNIFPLYLNNARRMQVDMPGVEVLDDVRAPLLMDYFDYEERHTSFQLFQRGVRWSTLKRAHLNWAKSLTPREIFTEWVLGLDLYQSLRRQLEREVIEKLTSSTALYLDYNTEEFDHVSHHVRESASQVAVLEGIDQTIGRVWVATQKSALAKQTAFIMVSDHGSQTNEKVYSQGFNLVTLLGKPEGGSHHVVTNRHLMRDYSISAVIPFNNITPTSSPVSNYLKGKHSDYPTAVLDFDGNERASLHLRNSDFNLMQILLQHLGDKRLSPALRQAVREAFLAIVARRRAGWQQTIRELEEELVVLRQAIETERALYASRWRTWSRRDFDAGRDEEVLRHKARARAWEDNEAGYRSFVVAMKKLLTFPGEGEDAPKGGLEDLLPRRAMGELNSVHQLQNYVVGLAEGGLTLSGDGSLDFEKSFRRINYFSLFSNYSVRNNVQAGVGNRPVDFVAVRVPLADLVPALTKAEMPHEDAVWLYASDERQALLLARRDDEGGLALRYLPVSRLQQHAGGEITFQRPAWGPGFPLKLYEDRALAIPPEKRTEWLQAWHTEVEWLEATHLTEYSNGLISLHEHFSRHPLPASPQAAGENLPDDRLLRRFRFRQRRLVEADFLMLANRHWNFDLRGFNPGGNHGSFFRTAELSTLMIVGGDDTGIANGKVISAPYDNLSFVPTVLAIMGRTKSLDPTSTRHQNEAAKLPGRVIKEIFQKRDGQLASSPP